MARSDSPIENLNASMRIVVLFGREAFLVEEGTRKLTERLEEQYGRIDCFRFDGETTPLADVLDELRSYGLLAAHKLVIVDNADKFLAPGGARDSGDDDGSKSSGGTSRRRALEAYAAKPAAEATLLLRAESWRAGKLDKLIDKVGARVRCDLLSDRDAASWCVAKCPGRWGLKIERPAAQLLVERLGPGLTRLDSELAKLASFVEGRPLITRTDAAAMVGHSRQEQAWALQSAIMSGRPPVSLGKLRDLLEVSRLDEVLPMWAITDLLRRLHTAAQLLRQGQDPPAVARDLRLWGDTRNAILTAARRTDPSRFAQLLQAAIDADQRTKSGFGKASRNLEALTVLVTDTIACS